MRPIFVDTSAMYAHLAAEDRSHAAAVATFKDLAARGAPLASSNYVLHEAVTLVQARLGIEAVRRLVEDLVPILDVTWVDRETHARALAALLAAGRRRVSLTDWTSFEVMRAHGLREAFAFDGDFEAQGFETIPGPPGNR